MIVLRAKENILRLRSAMRAEGDEGEKLASTFMNVRPVWRADEEVSNCHGCGSAFTLKWQFGFGFQFRFRRG